MLSPAEAPAITHRLQQKIEEIRTICRLHVHPSGNWENLLDLPLTLARNAGFRSDLVAIVRSLQREHLNLPDVLDLLVLAIGGNSASQHTRELSEQLNLLGGFLSSIGRWPDVDAEPILAPGEIPANIQKFTRPQPPAPPQQVQQQSPPPRILPAEPASVQSVRPEISLAPSEEDLRPDSRDADDSDDLNEQIDPELPASPLDLQPSPSVTPPEVDSTLIPLIDITRALARLERGNLELRAHLDSIDQRISRMEPLLESAAPLDTPPPSPVLPSPVQFSRPAASSAPLPHDLLQGPAQAGPPLSTDPSEAKPFHLKPVRSEALAPEPARTDPAPSRPLPNKPLPKETPSISPDRSDSGAHHLRPINSSLRTLPRAPEEPAANQKSAPPEQPTPISRFSRFSRDSARSEPGFNDPSFNNATPIDSAPIWPAGLKPESQDAVAPNPEPLAPKPGSSNLADPSPQDPSDQPTAPRPIVLPRGFMGTVPDTEETLSSTPEPEPVASRRARPRFALATILILLGLAAAGFLYFRSISGTGDPSSSAAAITATPAPRPSGAYSTHGPLSSTPSPTAAQAPAQTPASQRSNPAPSRVLGARNTFQPTESTEEPLSQSGFRPAGTFVSASVMDGHLISAPLPSQPRVSPTSGAQGLVVLEANISSTGQVEDLYVLGGNRGLRAPAIEAVRNWRYKPYLLNGTPVEVRTIIRVDFTEHQSQPADKGAPFPN